MTSKRLNDYYAPSASYIENGKSMVTGSDTARHVHHPSSRLRRSSGQTGKP
jgi:hypothetical protein